MRQLVPLLGLLALALLASCAARRAEPEPPAEPEAPAVEQVPPETPAPAQAPPEEAAQRSATLVFESFDGGGPEYRVEIDDPALLSCCSEAHYPKPDHDRMTGAGYTVTYTFTGLAPGTTLLTVRARSPIAENFDAIYRADVDDDLNVTLTEVETVDVFL